MNKKVLIVGNGKSSVNSNITEIVKDKDIFRVNRFYLEPKKIFGDKIKFLSCIGEPYSLFILNYLMNKNVYKIEKIGYKEMNSKHFFSPLISNKFIPWKKIELQYSLDDKVNGFNGLNRLNTKRKHDKITSGVYLINCAIQMGYDDISIVGIDFYSEKSLKKYPIITPEKLKKISLFEGQYRSKRRRKLKKSSYDDDLHSYETDSYYVQQIANQYKNIKFNIYVDEENPFNNWNKIASECDNIIVNLLAESSESGTELNSHCFNEINEAIDDYKSKYFFKDKYMRIINILNNKKTIIKKLFYYITDNEFMDKIRGIN